MTTLTVSLVLATLFCSLGAGFLFAFATVVMPGIGRLDDKGFLRAFQEIDGVIQRGQPLFVLVWAGSVLALVTSMVLGISQLDGADRLLLVAATLVYILGVQLPTFVINVPLNNVLQRVDLAETSGAEQARARSEFEPAWNRSNVFRTACASVATLLLLMLLLRL